MRLTKSSIEKLPVPETGQVFYRDDRLKPLAVRVTSGGTKSFIFEKLVGRRVRRFTIGRVEAISLEQARKKAQRMLGRIAEGHDPVAEIETDRNAKTVADLCDRFIAEYLPRKRPTTARDYRRAIEAWIRPALKHHKVGAVTFSDIDALHRKITRAGQKGKSAPYVANRTMSVISKLFAQSIRWGWRRDNPARGIERNQEDKRQRFLSPDEIASLSRVLAEYEDQQAANIIRLLLLTGARKGEVLSMRWQDLDLAAGTWSKPSSHTKQKKEHRVPLSAPALQLIAELRDEAKADKHFVFPGRFGGHRVEFKRAWAKISAAAGLIARVHDLRHTYASLLASSGLSLPIIGALLGHTQPATTARYAHLFDDPLRQATERVGAVVSGRPTAEVVLLRG